MTDSVNYTGQKKQGMALASLICGIIGIILSFLIIGGFLGILAVIFALIRFSQKPEKKGMLWSGFSLGIIGILLTIVFGYMYFLVYQKVQVAMKTGQSPFASASVNLSALPGPPMIDLSTANPSLTANKILDIPETGGETLALGDWNHDGTTDFIVGENGSSCTVFSMDSSTIANFLLPANFSAIEFTALPNGQPGLMGYQNWVNEIYLLDNNGKKSWTYPSRFGVDGAHLGDINGDGKPEMVIGHNGYGGVEVVHLFGNVIWKNTQLGNVWNQALIPEKPGIPGMVITTDASGKVTIFDSNGKKVNELSPMNSYVSPMNAADLDGNGTIQIAAQASAGNHFIDLAFDTTGSITWKCEVNSNHGSWRQRTFAHGDLDGDGMQDWVFAHDKSELVIMSGKGHVLSIVQVPALIKDFIVMESPNQPGSLCVLGNDKIYLYELKPKSNTENPVSQDTAK